MNELINEYYFKINFYRKINDKGNNKPSNYNFLSILLEFKSFCGDILSHFNVQIWEQPIGQTLSY